MAKSKKNDEAAETAGTAAATTQGTEGAPVEKTAVERGINDKFTYVGEPTKKIAPQAQVIVNLVKAAGEGGLTRAELVAAMKGAVVTRQPEGRILTYYQKMLVEVGALAITKAS